MYKHPQHCTNGCVHAWLVAVGTVSITPAPSCWPTLPRRAGHAARHACRPARHLGLAVVGPTVPALAAAAAVITGASVTAVRGGILTLHAVAPKPGTPPPHHAHGAPRAALLMGLGAHARRTPTSQDGLHAIRGEDGVPEGQCEHSSGALRMV